MCKPDDERKGREPRTTEPYVKPLSSPYPQGDLSPDLCRSNCRQIFTGMGAIRRAERSEYVVTSSPHSPRPSDGEASEKKSP